MRCTICRKEINEYVLAVLPGRDKLQPVCAEDRECYPVLSPKMRLVTKLATRYVLKGAIQ